MIKKTRIIVHSFLFLAVMLFIFFGTNHISKFLTADEHYWIYERIPQYWDALRSGNLKKTYINDKPGVSVALVSGVGYFANYNEIRSGIEQNKNIKSLEPHRDDHLERNLLALRLPLLLFNAFSLLFFFWAIRKLTENNWIALWSCSFIALSPVLVGVSQIINPDALLWTFTTGAILSYLNLLKSGERKFVILTGLLTGLALLTKYVAMILFPFFIFFLILHFAFEYGRKIAEENARSFLNRQLCSYGLIMMGTLLSIAILMPAVFAKISYLKKITVDFPGSLPTLLSMGLGIIFLLTSQAFNHKPIRLIQQYLLENNLLKRVLMLIMLLIFSVLIIGRNLIAKWSLFENVPFDIKNLSDIEINQNFFQLILLEFNPFVFSLTPIILLLLVLLWLKSLAKPISHQFLTIALSVFMLLYFIASIFSDTLATIRYSIILYPLAAILAAVSLWEISFFMKLRLKNIFLSITIMIISLFSIQSISPFYFNYANSLLPKNQIITDSWGYGGYEAARYLNSLENADKIVVWSDFFGVCEFIKGQCHTAYTLNPNIKIDYYVLTRRGQIRLKGKRENAGAKKYYALSNPIWQLEIDDRPDNYIKIFKSRD